MQTSNKHIFIVTYDYPPSNGGIARLCFELKKYLEKKGLNVTVICPQSTSTDAEEDNNVVRLHGRRGILELRTLKYLRKKTVPGDIVITGNYHPEGMLSLLSNRETYILAHGAEYLAGKSFFRRCIWPTYRRFILRNASCVIANSHYTETLVKHCSPNAKTIAIPLAVDAIHFRPTCEKYKDGLLHLCSISRLEKFKGHDFIIRTIASLPAKYKQQVRLHLGGKGKYKSALERMVTDLGLSVTVFTPVYNRKNLIGNLYQSLLSQTYKNFEWIIVDDGSTDDIDEIIKSYQNEDRILIRFIKQENGGKHRAINNGVLHAKGELFYIVDSDDYLTKDSIERIVFHYQYIKNNDKFAGVCGMKCFPDGSRIGKEVTWKILKDSWINYWIIKNIKGDVAFVFKTSVLRNYLFDDIPGEKFCAESLVLNRIGKNYLMLFFNEKIYIAEYLSDGLSVSSIKNRMNSPNYAMRIYSEMASLDIPYLKKIKAHINYWRFAPCSKLKMKNKIKQIGISSYIIFMPIGYLFHMKDKKNNYIDIRHVGSKR